VLCSLRCVHGVVNQQQGTTSSERVRAVCASGTCNVTVYLVARARQGWQRLVVRVAYVDMSLM
jgi:hypothetical protein